MMLHQTRLKHVPAVMVISRDTQRIIIYGLMIDVLPASNHGMEQSLIQLHDTFHRTSCAHLRAV